MTGRIWRVAAILRLNQPSQTIGPGSGGDLVAGPNKRSNPPPRPPLCRAAGSHDRRSLTFLPRAARVRACQFASLGQISCGQLLMPYQTCYVLACQSVPGIGACNVMDVPRSPRPYLLCAGTLAGHRPQHARSSSVLSPQVGQPTPGRPASPFGAANSRVIAVAVAAVWPPWSGIFSAPTRLRRPSLPCLQLVAFSASAVACRLPSLRSSPF
jgi:hypothetical protein